MNNQTTTPTDAQRAEILASIEAKRDEKIQTLLDTVERKLALGGRAEAEFAQSVTESGLLWALGWSGRETARILAEAEKWREVRAAYFSAITPQDKNGWLASAVGAVSAIRDEVERQLLRNSVRQVSSDEFSTAVSGARAEGYARFYRDSERVLRAIMENDE